MMTARRLLVAACLALTAISPTGAAVEVSTTQPPVEVSTAFGHQMVLQRDRAVPVWGRAAPGAAVTVTFAGQTKTVNAEADGNWLLRLDPMRASAEPRPLTLRSGAGEVTIREVLVGDVWLYAGDIIGLNYYQGRFAKRSRMGNYYDINPFIRQDIAAKRPPIIRMLRAVPGGRNQRHTPHARRRFHDGSAGWPAYDSERWGGCTAFSYFFGREYWAKVNVPVGVIEVGLDALDSMTPPEGFEATPAMQAMAKEVRRWDPTGSAGKAAYSRTLGELRRWLTDTRARLDAGSTDFDDFSQAPRMPGPPPNRPGPTTYYNGSLHSLAPFAMRGLILKTLQQNMGDPLYAAKAEALIRGLRAVLGCPGAPAALFQFRPPMYWEVRDVSDPNVWMAFRRTQQAAEKVPNSSVLPAHDFVHDPRDPRNWAERGARWALAVTAAAETRSGPAYASHKSKGGKLTVRFDRVGAGLIVGRKAQGDPVRPAPAAALGGFQIASADGQWHDAAATIAADTVVLTARGVARPTAARYAWAPRPSEANLYNRDGFPALPFNTTAR